MAEKLLHKKSLGQHFLHSSHYLSLIADSAQVDKNSTVIEIGPGDGALTAVLLERGAQVIAVEKDHRLIPILKEKFANEITKGKSEVVEQDALEFEVADFVKGEYTLVGNIPYYITGALLKKFLTGACQPQRLVFLMQKEVAERIARSKKESILSLSVKAYGEPKYVKTIPRGAFQPAPKVDSAILLVDNVSRKHFKSKREEETFFELVRAGFAQKRKLLKRNIESVLGEKTTTCMQKASIAPNARAEDVALTQWLALVREM
jgi:16S rRNA (adenine1518-N6/adenine1519-N6)-dimethyltransferase